MILQLLAGAAVLGGVYEYTQDGKVQVHKGVTVDGIPVAAAIPVVKAVSALQANPSLFNPGPKPPGYTPPVVPIAFPGSGTLNLSPIVITPTGGSNVAVLTDTDAQTALNTLGVANPPLLVDGNIGPASQAALRIFQITTGIPATGQADPATKAALSVALATIGSPSASIGRSPQVLAATVQSAAATVPIVSNRDVQHALNVLGATPQLARPRHWPRPGDRARHAGPFEAHEEQPRTDRRAWCRQDGNRRRPFTADRLERRARDFEG